MRLEITPFTKLIQQMTWIKPCQTGLSSTQNSTYNTDINIATVWPSWQWWHSRCLSGSSDWLWYTNEHCASVVKNWFSELKKFQELIYTNWGKSQLHLVPEHSRSNEEADIKSEYLYEQIMFYTLAPNLDCSVYQRQVPAGYVNGRYNFVIKRTYLISLLLAATSSKESMTEYMWSLSTIFSAVKKEAVLFSRYHKTLDYNNSEKLA